MISEIIVFKEKKLFFFFFLAFIYDIGLGQNV